MAIVVLWVGLTRAIIDDYSGDTRDSRALVHNLSLALEEHARRTVQSVDQALVFLLHRYAQDPAGFDPVALLRHELQPTGLPISISLLDRDGWLVLSSEPIGGRLNYADRQHFRFHRSTPDSGLFIGEPVLTRRSGEIRMRFSRSIRDAQGNFAGVMAILLDPAYFVRLYQGMDVGKAGIISLFSREGEEYVRRTGAAVTFGGTLRDGPLFDLVSRYAGGEVFEGAAPGAGPLLISSHLLDDLPVGVMLGLNRDEVLAGFREKTWRTVLVGVMLTAVLLVLSGLLVRRIRIHAAASAELERTSRAAESASAAKSAFLAAMSHELRTPLNAILGYSEVMVHQMFGPLDERYRGYAGLIHHSGAHLLDMISGVLDFARLEDGSVVVTEERVSLPPLLDACLEQARGLPDGHGLTLTASVPRDLPDLRADRTRLAQVMMHLLSNAVKFTPPGGRVTVHAAAGLSGLAVTVQDTGSGIAADDIAHVMEPFSQGGDPLHRRHGGTGLGLPLARELTRLMGGSLHVDSSPGHGTAVTLLFPPARVLPPAGPAAPDDKESRSSP
ncbi:signal transduction histidine kinase [Azospirillum fermentarium]|uniref:sensor histidine kinase n=1 Tax=Azospirillum fermentarium TaxID=1233114 RepID=UPI0022275261|nr:ATP-binding protein [Azospirillum fermentarium]MCW2245178.1 signal transduction histidine kinase [Azospirillum fermentarium]